MSDGLLSKLDAARDLMQDTATPPGYHIATDPDGKFMVIKDATSEIFSVEVEEADLPLLVADLWREFVQEAPSHVVVRLAQTMTALDALVTWKGEISGRPLDAPQEAPNGPHTRTFECLLWGMGGDEGKSAQGLDNDVIIAMLKARRELLESLKGLEDKAHDPADENPDDDMSDEEFAHTIDDPGGDT